MSGEKSARPSGALCAYRVEVLQEPVCGPEGLRHSAATGEPEIVLWNRVRCAVAAEIGEPEGVRTIVFDLQLERSASGVRVLRFDADPGEVAMRVARQLSEALGPDRSGPSIKSVAVDGIASRWYPDLESFEADARRGNSR
jgi:hypothetical protein